MQAVAAAAGRAARIEAAASATASASRGASASRPSVTRHIERQRECFPACERVDSLSGTSERWIARGSHREGGAVCSLAAWAGARRASETAAAAAREGTGTDLTPLGGTRAITHTAEERRLHAHHSLTLSHRRAASSLNQPNASTESTRHQPPWPSQ